MKVFYGTNQGREKDLPRDKGAGRMGHGVICGALACVMWIGIAHAQPKSPLESKVDKSLALSESGGIEGSISESSISKGSFSESSTEPSSKIEQSHSLSALVTTATGSSQLAKDAPASITSISRKETESKPHKDIAEMIAGIPGVDIGQGMGRGGSAEISIRGMPSDYTLILIDGKRQSVGGAVNTFNNGYSQMDNAYFPPLSAIERIEVIRGPLSTLYGSDAMGGVVNIITKKRIDTYAVSFNVESVLNEHKAFGNQYASNLFVSVPLMGDVLGLQLRGRYFYHTPASITYSGVINTAQGDNKGANINGFQVGQIVSGVPDGGIGNPTKAQNYDVGARLLYNPRGSDHIYLDTQFSRQSYDNSKEQWGPHTSVASEYVLKRNNSILAHEGTYATWSVKNSLQLNQSFNEGRLYKSIPRDIWGRDVIAESKAFIDLPFENLLSLGGSYWYSSMHDAIGDPSLFSQHTLSLFAENEAPLFENLTLTLAAREDYNSRFGFHTSPKAYLVFEIIPDWLILKGGVSSGYKAPYLNELVNGVIGVGNQGNRVTIGNPDLKPESSISGEVSVLSQNEYFEAGATYFYTYFKDKITNKNYGANTPQCSPFGSGNCALRVNVDRAQILGAEAFFGADLGEFFRLDMSYTYTQSEQLSGSMKGYALDNTLSHLAHAKLGFEAGDLSLYIRGEAQGRRFRGLTPNSVREQILSAYYKPYFLAHIGGSYKIAKHLKCGFGIYNLFDKNFVDFRHADFYPSASTKYGEPYFFNMYNTIQEGRRYYLSLNLDF